MQLDTCIGALETQLLKPLPGQEAQFEMAPLDRQDHIRAGVRDAPCREAAVLALLYPDNAGRAHLLLTVRPDGMKQHAGQVALPGGRREDGESLTETVLRETQEEVLIPPDRIELLGTLTPLYVIPSNFNVHPYIGYTTETPDLSVRTDEVADLFGVLPLDLVATEKRRSRRQRVGQWERNVPYFDLDGYVVWGATAMMLAEFAAVLQAAVPTPS